MRARAMIRTFPPLGICAVAIFFAIDAGKSAADERSDPPEIAEAAVMARDISQLTEVTRDDGSVDVILNGTFQHVSAVRLAPDGSREQRCINDPRELEEFLAGEEPTFQNNETSAR